MKTIYCVEYTHKHGQDLYAHSTYEKALKRAADVAKDNVDELEFEIIKSFNELYEKDNLNEALDLFNSNNTGIYGEPETISIYALIVDQGEPCKYCGGICPDQPDDSPDLCDGYAGDVDGLYAE